MAKRWYVLHVYSGFENKVAEEIQKKAGKQGLADRIEQVMVPKEDVIEIKRGQKVAGERNFFPGYVLAKIDMSDDIWHLIKNTPKVTGFLGASNKPHPITEAEAERLIKQMQEGVVNPRRTVTFEVGEEVKVAEGPFASFNGIVEEVDEDKGRVKVSVSIFGRATPVDLEFGQVEKI